MAGGRIAGAVDEVPRKPFDAVSPHLRRFAAASPPSRRGFQKENGAGIAPRAAFRIEGFGD
jgi:hypothetical protein